MARFGYVGDSSSAEVFLLQLLLLSIYIYIYSLWACIQCILTSMSTLGKHGLVCIAMGDAKVNRH